MGGRMGWRLRVLSWQLEHRGRLESRRGAGRGVRQAHAGRSADRSGSRLADTAVRIGDRNQIREHVTIHRGTIDGRGETVLGSDNYIMVGCHLAHDCVVGDRVTMANLATLAGHVVVEDDAVLGGFAGAHQRCRVGRGAMVAAMSRMSQDAPPYAMVGGEPLKFIGLNRVGLKRLQLTEEAKTALRRCYRIIFSPDDRFVVISCGPAESLMTLLVSADKQSIRRWKKAVRWDLDPAPAAGRLAWVNVLLRKQN